MPNMEQLISPISTKTGDEPVDESWIPKLALDYAYGQLQLSEKPFSCNFAVTRGNSSGYYQFLKHFSAGRQTIFKDKFDQRLGNKHPVWLDAVIVV